LDKWLYQEDKERGRDREFTEREAMEPSKKSARQGDNQQAIASIVRGLPQGIHLTAPEVFEKAKEKGLEVSLSTVYRTLSRLKHTGDVITVLGERGLRYETTEKGPEHDHLICLGCGLTIEFVDEVIRNFGETIAQRKGYEIVSSRFDILGYCQKCNVKDDRHKSEHMTEDLNRALKAAERVVQMVKQSLEYNEAGKYDQALKNTANSIAHIKSLLSDCEGITAIPADAEPS
jgi:Fur family transcriptional regulator, ferric uptake regulator